MDEARPDRLTISVVLPTTDGWSHVASCVEGLATQVERCNGEVIVAIGSGTAPERIPDRVRIVEAAGESVFALRARAVEAARGEVIAITEDHCIVSDDWCRRLVQVHAEHPDALAVAGAVDNGSPERIRDWANYLPTFAAYASPLKPQSDRAMPIANGSFKRAALDGAPVPLPTGWLEFDLGRRLLQDGAIVFDDRAVVLHVQAPGIRRMLASHFHNGRSTTGLLRDELSPAARRQEVRRRWRLPWVLLRQTWNHAWPKPSLRRPLLVSLPLVASLACAHAIGEVSGLLVGAGRSPHQLD